MSYSQSFHWMVRDFKKVFENLVIKIHVEEAGEEPTLKGGNADFICILGRYISVNSTEENFNGNVPFLGKYGPLLQLCFC